MPKLKFDIEFTVGVAFAGSEFPIENGTQVIAQFDVIRLEPVTSDVESRYPGTVWTAMLSPICEGEDDDDDLELWMEVKLLNTPTKSVNLIYLFDNESVLFAFLTSQDELSIPSTRVEATVVLTVKNIMSIAPAHWLATLVPCGEQVGNFIISEVEITEVG